VSIGNEGSAFRLRKLLRKWNNSLMDPDNLQKENGIEEFSRFHSRKELIIINKQNRTLLWNDAPSNALPSMPNPNLQNVSPRLYLPKKRKMRVANRIPDHYDANMTLDQYFQEVILHKRMADE
jgi:hypothetical protein